MSRYNIFPNCDVFVLLSAHVKTAVFQSIVISTCAVRKKVVISTLNCFESQIKCAIYYTQVKQISVIHRYTEKPSGTKILNVPRVAKPTWMLSLLLTARWRNLSLHVRSRLLLECRVLAIASLIIIVSPKYFWKWCLTSVIPNQLHVYLIFISK